MSNWRDGDIIVREDGSYIIEMNGYPYHVPVDDTAYGALWGEVHDFVLANPDRVTQEVPYVPEVEETIVDDTEFPAEYSEATDPFIEHDPAIIHQQGIYDALDEVDYLSVRAIRAILTGTATDDDRELLAKMEDYAIFLRSQLGQPISVTEE